jgi:hypothetical protein
MKKNKLLKFRNLSEAICENTAFMCQEWRHKSGAVDLSINSYISDMSDQAAD